MEGEHPNTVFCPYTVKSFDYPKEDTMVSYILARVEEICALGYGETPWNTNTVTGANCKFSQILPLSRQIASSLYRRGLRKNDVVLFSTNEPHLIHIFFLGVWRANGALRPVYPGEDSQWTVKWIRESKAKFFLCDDSTLAEVQKAVKDVEWPVEIICMDPCPSVTTLQDLLIDDGSACPSLDVDGNDTAVLLATSGTTGISKGCVHTHQSILATLTCYRDWLYNHEWLGQPGIHSTLMLGRPTHISGFTFPFSAMGAGKEIFMMRNVSKENIFRAVHKYKPHIAFSFPTYLLNLASDPEGVDYDFTSIRYVMTGGVVIHRSFVEAMNTKLGAEVVVVYGMSECAIMCSTRNFDPLTQKEHFNLPGIPDMSVGKLAPGTLLQVRDVDKGEPLPAYKRGELCYKNPLKCRGYFNRPDEDAKTFPDGWVRSGDIGYYDDDKFIFIVNRLKECFKYFNNHISPSELEMVINRHPSVEKANVVGVTDSNGGDTIPRAFVTLKDPSDPIQSSIIRKFANENLAGYKKLRGGLFILPDFPLGKTGKVNTEELKRMQLPFPQDDSI